MRLLNPALDFEAFLHSLQREWRRLLMLDYDGTLAPFTPQRDRALPYKGVRALIERMLNAGTARVVVVSGRSIRNLRPLIATEPLPEIWGSHGWERLLPDGSYQAPELPRRAAEVIAQEWAWLAGLYSADRVELKPASVAVHWRGFAEEECARTRQTVQQRWQGRALPDLLDLHAFDGGLELRACGRTKADAVRTLLQEAEARTVCAFLGDDQTDEEAFAALDGRGLRVLIRKEPRPTQADVQLVPPEELLDFLVRWTEAPT